jgi:hypothetical protein
VDNGLSVEGKRLTATDAADKNRITFIFLRRAHYKIVSLAAKRLDD